MEERTQNSVAKQGFALTAGEVSTEPLAISSLGDNPSYELSEATLLYIFALTYRTQKPQKSLLACSRTAV